MMNSLRLIARALLSISLLASPSIAQSAAQSPQTPYRYQRVGNSADISTKTQAGFALMGGGENQEAAFRWLCNRSSGGDFLAIGAVDTDRYNSYVSGMCKQNSVATLVIPTREAA